MEEKKITATAENEKERCPFFGGKIDRYDGVGICCNGRNERYESEFERDAWLAMRCECENYRKCDAYDQISASQAGTDKRKEQILEYADEDTAYYANQEVLRPLA